MDDRPPSGSENVLIFKAEDRTEDTVKPRLHPLGDDLDRAFFLNGVVECHGEEPMRFAAETWVLRDAVPEIRLPTRDQPRSCLLGLNHRIGISRGGVPALPG
jgi:hypothetical protein